MPLDLLRPEAKPLLSLLTYELVNPPWGFRLCDPFPLPAAEGVLHDRKVK